jgi:type VI secretion system protein ImpA
MPASDDQPAGPELRSAADTDVKKLFSDVREARKRAIDAERRLRNFALMTDEERSGEPGPPDPPDWEAVRRKSMTALTSSKDLWITAWLIEALTRLQGFGGLRDGIRLAHGLCDAFWQDVHPQATKEEGLVTRFAQLAGLDGGPDSEGTLLAPIRNVAITADTPAGQFSLADYYDAVDLERKPPDIRRRRAEQGVATVELFQQAMTATSADFIRSLADDLEQAHSACAEFNTFLKQKESEVIAGGGAPFVPSSSRIRELLDESLRTYKGLTKHVLQDPIAQGPGATGPAGYEEAGEVSNERLLANSSVKSRQEAFQVLSRVSEYFRQTEPHSPISYALEQVVRWGRMSLPELLAELVTDRSARDEIFKRTGITEDSSDK